MDSLRRAAGLIASVLLLALGCVLVMGSPLIGGGLLITGLAATLWHARKLFAERQDPYDLSRLFDKPEPDYGDADAEPDEEGFVGEPGMLLCHACGHAVPKNWGQCPECGRRLG